MQTFLRVKYDRTATATSSAAENMEATKHRRVSNRTATERLEYAEICYTKINIEQPLTK